MKEIYYFGVKFTEPIYPSYNHTYHGSLCSDEINLKLKFDQIKKQPCEICGKVENVQAHHEDYNYPLIVRWLCITHHLDIHSIFRKMKRRGIKGKMQLF